MTKPNVTQLRHLYMRIDRLAEMAWTQCGEIVSINVDNMLAILGQMEYVCQACYDAKFDDGVNHDS